MRTQFPSRVDAWLVALLAGVPLFLIGLGVLALSKSTSAGLVQVGVGLAVGVAIAACSIPCRYTLGAAHLQIQSGVLNEEIDLTKIHGVELVRSFQSAPAWSTWRVKLILDDGYRLISPRDRDAFVQTLQAQLGRELPRTAQGAAGGDCRS